ncbi:hypothetical protein FJ981_28085 [Mesorhizobium sp. B1-1-4]|uniref:hypothetical protein n=1 Tax=Mesorhizobium sp. B1-1-4 TaxID=2589980 RepID=UPI00112D89E1|nr:hypothetical protein [Mesorhizobium sp. B1-1-4]TPN44458.1 hypothetical protein FJ981_28085 [Mesorhizobium sp. B1-1-4]
MQIVYSRTPVPNMEGRKLQNPRHFAGPIAGATKVYIDGDWPAIAAAYKAANVPVAPITEMRALPGQPKENGK